MTSTALINSKREWAKTEACEILSALRKQTTEGFDRLCAIRNLTWNTKLEGNIQIATHQLLKSEDLLKVAYDAVTKDNREVSKK